MSLETPAAPPAAAGQVPPRAWTTEDFDFELPPELVAQQPAAERSASRLLAGTAGALLTFSQRSIALIERWLTPLFDLAIRLYVASVFFKSGLTKIQDWSSTVALFQYE